MKLLFLALVTITCISCVSVKESTRISTNLRASEYNDISAKYMERPTYSEVQNMSDGRNVLTISRDNYGTQTSPIRFDKTHVNDYLALIEKYFEWEKIATSRQDAITKEIGTAEAWANATSAKLKFVFHSGNSDVHYLSVAFCAAGTCLDQDALYFNLQNVQILQDLLIKYSKDEIAIQDIDSVYK